MSSRGGHRHSLRGSAAGPVSPKRSTIPGMMPDPVRRLIPPNVQPLEQRARAFGETIGQAKGGHILLALRGHPDPDGIASAMAQAHIAQRLGVNATIAYCHELSHRENRALVKLLGLELRKIKS